VGSNVEYKGRHEVSVHNPTLTWVFGDDDPYDSVTQSGGGGHGVPSDCDGVHQYWTELHNGGGNYAFLDGHVKWLTPAAIEKVYCSN
jgi:prepilin-type processing-associated H-X9-DG protein